MKDLNELSNRELKRIKLRDKIIMTAMPAVTSLIVTTTLSKKIKNPATLIAVGIFSGAIAAAILETRLSTQIDDVEAVLAKRNLQNIELD